MSYELVRALRSVYDDIDTSETGRPTRAAVSAIWPSLQAYPDAARVTALWSAARALVFPQVALEAVELCAKAIDAVQSIVSARGVFAIPTEVEVILQHPWSGTLSNSVQVEAQHCLGHALACCIQPTPDRFMQVIDLLVAAQRSEFAHPARAKQGWIGWLDDVVSRSDRFDAKTMLDLVERTLQGTLYMIPEPFEWEGVADDSGTLEVWAKDPKTRRLLMPAMATKPLVVEERALKVTVLDQPQLVRDPLRIEYFEEHTIHRRFLGGMYAGLYDRIDYRCLATGEAWQASA